MDSKIPKWNGSSWDIVDKPKDIVVKEETSKKTDEVIGDLLNKIIDLEAKVSELETKASDLETKTEKLITNTEEQQIKIDKQEKEIEDLRQLVNGLIMSTLNTIPS
jgi:predicted RNase H-like nuclease (RuvC/YqgF family)